MKHLFLGCLLLPLGLLTACGVFQANANSIDIRPTDYNASQHSITEINSFLLRLKKHKGFPVTELSDLAWDNDDKKLYAISDEGLLYTMDLLIDKSAITSINMLSAKPLLNKKKQALKGKFSDAEGLDILNGNNGIKGDAQLLIAFENKPRIALYSTQGELVKHIKTHKKLQKRRYFRHGNKALESVVNHPQHGILTAPEQPLKENSLNQQSLYDAQGNAWNFDALKIKNSSITALEHLPNGDILILERAYNGIFSPIVITLRQLKLNDCSKSRYCKTKTLVTMNSSKGWLVDNFEGLTQINPRQYLMVSDNNGNPIQKTIFVLFTIAEE